MNPFLGILFHAIGGLAAGSFYAPFHQIKGWSWETCWLVMNLLAYLIMPWAVALLVVPQTIDVLRYSPPNTLLAVYVCGLLWGIGGLTFGLTLRYLGMSLGMAVSLGLCATFGTLVPPLAHGQFGQLLSTAAGWTVLAGVGVCLAGIGLIGYAGMRKEREMAEEQKQKSVKEFSLAKGFLTAVIAGVMSSFMAFGIDAARPIGQLAVESNISEVYRNAPVLILVMSGNFTTNLIWCLVLNLKNKSIGDYLRGPGGLMLSNYFFAALAGMLAYGEFFWYGMGTTQMGEYDFSSWSIHLAFVIVFSTIWGIYFQEWKGVGLKTWLYVLSGLAVLIISTIVIGAGNTISTSTT